MVASLWWLPAQAMGGAHRGDLRGDLELGQDGFHLRADGGRRDEVEGSDLGYGATVPEVLQDLFLAARETFEALAESGQLASSMSRRTACAMSSSRSRTSRTRSPSVRRLTIEMRSLSGRDFGKTARAPRRSACPQQAGWVVDVRMTTSAPARVSGAIVPIHGSPASSVVPRITMLARARRICEVSAAVLACSGGAGRSRASKRCLDSASSKDSPTSGWDSTMATRLLTGVRPGRGLVTTVMPQPARRSCADSGRGVGRDMSGPSMGGC